MPLSAFVVAGTHSGAGKTTVSLGLMAALRRRGLTVQPFKVGPDFIDPMHHTRTCGRPSRNLDGWMLSPQANTERFGTATADADAAIVEGVMGLFDGVDGASDRGSTAEMAKLLGLPVVLVVDAGAMARSAAAVVHGYATYDPAVRVAGVIFNNVGGAAHAGMLRDAVTGSVPVFGALPREDGIVVPERHLGLHLPHETEDAFTARLADLLEAHVDVEGLLERTRVEVVATSNGATLRSPSPAVRVALARDEAFCFYYEDNLDILRAAGAELVPFSPIRDPLPSGIGGVYIGGGYPELHAEQLAGNADTRKAIREFAAAGGPIYAECGGLMYLASVLEVDGTSYPQCGVFPFTTRIPAGLALAYVTARTTGGLFDAGLTARGQLYHHSAVVGSPGVPCSFVLETSDGDTADEGYTAGNVVGTYAHLHFASEPRLAHAFVKRSQAFAGP